MNYRSVVYTCPTATLEPGEKKTFHIDPKGVFRATKLLMVAIMDVVRGHFRLKFLPRAKQMLNREQVIAYSKWSRVKSRRRTIIEYREHASGNFVRSYQPASVQYISIEALHYIKLLNVFVGTEAQMPLGQGASAAFMLIRLTTNRLGVRL